MKQFVAIFLFSLYLFGSTDAYQLLKLPKLIEHYRLHRQLNAELSLADFLLIHYNGTLVIDSDYEQDMQLPFKTTQVEFSNTVSLVVPAPTVVKQVIMQPLENNFIICNDSVPSLYNSNAVFQPPRC
ncbi:MAG TPA: hypothetical protein PLA68_09925 [Panacibacter sp.]|nr:hypothetical protein [Panacibacter sp.]